MTFDALMELCYKAMLPRFSVFGVSLNLWSLFVFSVVMSVIIWFINKISRW